jgi:multidrug efflux pump subunit AcrA (membrane-fusion protein)
METRLWGLVLVGLAGMALLPCRVFSQQQATCGQTLTVQEARIGNTLMLGGTVVPRKEVTLAAQLPGRVQFIAGTEGDRFSERSQLVRLGTAELQAQWQAARADLANAEAVMRSAEVQYSRELISPRTRSLQGGMGLPSLFDQMFTRPAGSMMGTTSPSLERWSDLHTTGAQVEQARNAIFRAQSQLQAINAKLRDSVSIAPFDGVIVNKFVEEGDTVQPGQPLLRFAKVDDLQIQVDVPARLMLGVREGIIVRARLDVGNSVVSARVAQIFPMADPQRHTVTVKFDLPPGGPARPGMYAEVTLPDVTAPVRTMPIIPKQAVKWRGSLPGVYVINREGKPELRLIRVGDELDRDLVSVLSGLQAGEQICQRPPPLSRGQGW